MSVHIYSPGKTATQSGSAKSQRWLVEFDAEKPRTIDPIMGWTSSSDMNSQVKLWFDSEESAVAYAVKHGLDYSLAEPQQLQRKGMSYSDNFRSTRIGAWTH